MSYLTNVRAQCMEETLVVLPHLLPMWEGALSKAKICTVEVSSTELGPPARSVSLTLQVLSRLIPTSQRQSYAR